MNDPTKNDYTITTWRYPHQLCMRVTHKESGITVHGWGESLARLSGALIADIDRQLAASTDIGD